MVGYWSAQVWGKRGSHTEVAALDGGHPLKASAPYERKAKPELGLKMLAAIDL